MNVQAEVRRVLSGALAPTEVRVNAPNPLPAELATVRRTGGSARRRVYEDSTLEAMFWAPTEAGAEELCAKARDALSALSFADGFSSYEELAVRSDYDLLADRPRWYLRFVVTTYAPPDN